jgi:ERCC4-type nuclease
VLLIDPRQGSKELFPFFKNLGIPVSISKDELPSGDFAFEGRGPDGTCLIGVERKTIRDMLSSIRTGRFSGHQLPLLTQMYQFSYLLIEGIYRPNPIDGVLEGPWRHEWSPIEINGQRFMYQELAGFTYTIEQLTPVKVHYTSSTRETAFHIMSLYRWWNNKDFDKHRAHLACNAGHVEMFTEWPLARRVAKEMYKVGMETSLSISKHFGSVARMATADEREWSEIQVPCGRKTKRLGRVIASKIVKEINGL